MLEAIERIDRYAEKGREAFEKDELIQNWFVHHLQIVGEAAAKLGRRFHEDHPELPWAQIVGMRNVLVHDYFGVDLEEVWPRWSGTCPPSNNRFSRLSTN
jgi:uncharacterized protein with HEPN domain